jgi:hypothetical protein
MDKHNRPKAFGVFKPIGHVLMAFQEAEDLHAAETALGQQGFGAQDLTSYQPQEMLRQTEEDMHDAGLLATIGQELNLVKAHHALAEAGCSFLVVHAPQDEQVRQVADVALRTNATSAQRYGRFIIEELISSPRGKRQVFESHDRGLDVDVPDEPRH